MHKLYSVDFRALQPEGEGKYDWSDGSSYDGGWKVRWESFFLGCPSQCPTKCCGPGCGNVSVNLCRLGVIQLSTVTAIVCASAKQVLTPAALGLGVQQPLACL